MRPLVFDARWIGSHGIGRFAREVRDRLGLPLVEFNGAHPVSVRGLAELQLPGRRSGTGRGALFFSPGYCPPLGWSGPVVLTIHDLIHLDVPAERNPAKALYYRHVVRPALRSAPVTLTVSRFSQERIAEWAGLPLERIRVVGNGVDPRYRPGGRTHDPGYPYLLAVGNDKPHKNLPRLIEAWAQVDDPGLRLVLSGPPRQELARLADRLGVGRRLIFAGFIDEADLPAFYRGARAVVIPSTYEGFGLPALEGLASGVPVVAAGTTSLPEVTGGVSIDVDPHDSADIARGISLAMDASLARELRARGPLQAARFTWHRVAEGVSEALRPLLD